jgi:hypothetical protein
MTKHGLWLLAAVAVALLADNPAGAEVQYAWCAQYRRPIDATNCGFNTYQQCLATISGIGGYCYRNPAYPDPPPRRRTRPRGS